MPSKRKRVGYLPSPSIQEIIIMIANKEKLSQSKVVGLLVQEALAARGLIDLNSSNHLTNTNFYSIEKYKDDSSFTYNDLDELISDKGITYNKKNSKVNSEDIFSESRAANNKEMFELFKQFLLFQKMLKEK